MVLTSIWSPEGRQSGAPDGPLLVCFGGAIAQVLPLCYPPRSELQRAQKRQAYFSCSELSIFDILRPELLVVHQDPDLQKVHVG